MASARVVVLMGVAGCGKSTVGPLLAAELGGRFVDGDDYHPASNRAKMAAGLALDDHDRAPWLRRLRQEVIDAAAPGEWVVVACSALKRRYRQQLGVGRPGVQLVYLRVDPLTLRSRLQCRAGHFMKEPMLASQLATLEEPAPEEGLTVDAAAPLAEVVATIVAALEGADVRKNR